MDSYPGPYGQVLTNLVLNALMHGFPDERAGPCCSRPSGSGPDQFEIQFADDGIGMSEDVQRRAFEPFFTTRRSAGGTGLGLHIVYNLVTRRLGGRLTLQSEVPGGARRSRSGCRLRRSQDEFASILPGRFIGTSRT